MLSWLKKVGKALLHDPMCTNRNTPKGSFVSVSGSEELQRYVFVHHDGHTETTVVQDVRTGENLVLDDHLVNRIARDHAA